jgi:hypothetical protein
MSSPVGVRISGIARGAIGGADAASIRAAFSASSICCFDRLRDECGLALGTPPLYQGAGSAPGRYFIGGGPGFLVSILGLAFLPTG